MKIMTFNTQHCKNFITGEIDFKIMADAINKCNPDIVGLNEMYDEGETENFVNQTKILSELTGLKYHYFAKSIDSYGGKNPYGNGFLSKIPIVSAKTVMIPDPVREEGKKHYETRCILKAELENGFTVLVTHIGLVDTEQKNAVETILENITSEKCILMGDFNVRPENELLNPIRECMTDTADMFEKPLCSWPSDNPIGKIDYIFVSPDIKILSADIPEIVASDHRPHIAEIECK
ncbi:MAG: endonuclease/exonuclease/phosphatase family protein [Clostridia bacterium]|nr:endonuclease/exonuclease/phosphatase family protein [Clostridia bacterium]